MKRWRVVRFPTAEEAEGYLNGLSIEPDQIKGMFANPPSGKDAGGLLLVCWLSAHQQRVEQLQQQPRLEEDRAPAPEPDEPHVARQPRTARRRADADPA
ncbi:MAG TPA: hypothetical protein VFE37_12715 [Chloroflexota bacterium]|nr:hypothetical protein [Chloroflexota bacterium]